MEGMAQHMDVPAPESESLQEAIKERYLQYALSTIMDRALPDARDGLKPVHRRILFAMRELKLGPAGPFRKSAKISGDVMGNFHPHGDQAIYDALVRLAQGFIIRYPLVDGQGNFGNIDGDNAAAARYTEARLTAAAEALMDGLDEDAVDFRPNYDGTREEPAVMPASIPNLLANGASGIAVGMATEIPPHNLGELCGACLHLVKHPNAGNEALVKHVPGPDFPTGGLIVEPAENIREAYNTGKGSIRLRAAWSVEELDRGQWQAVVTEIPFQVKKSRLIERVAALIQSKKIPAVADVRDESADDVRIVLEPKSRNIDPQAMMETLFRNSELEIRYSMNMNALIDGRTPKVCSLKDVLTAFLQHRQEVLLRRARHRRDKIDRRLEVLEGYIVAFLNLDRVIEIIRHDDSPKQTLMAEFELSDAQAEAILNMRLRNLRKLEEAELRRERDELFLERSELEDLLETKALQWERIAGELKDIRKRFGGSASGGARRTEFAEAPQVEELTAEATIEREPATVICSKMGWVRAMKGAVPLDQEFKYRDGDEGRFVFHAETTDKLLLFGSNGRFYTVPVSSLPGGRGLGEPIRVMVELPNEAEICALFPYRAGRKLLLASAAGYGFVTDEDGVVAVTRNGKQVMNVRPPDSARFCVHLDGDHVALSGENRRLLVFAASDLPELSRGRGVRMQKRSQGGLADVASFNIADGLSWQDPAGRTRTEKDLGVWKGKRGSAGRLPPRGFPKDNKFT